MSITGTSRRASLALGVALAAFTTLSACGGGGSGSPGGGGFAFETMIPPNADGGFSPVGQNLVNLRAQYLYPASEVSAVPVGSLITGFRLRLDTNQTSCPASSVPRFDVYLGQGGASLGSDLDANFVATPTLVRSGAYSYAANEYPFTHVSGGSNPFGPVIPFATPFLYTGGPLLLEIRCAGVTGFENMGFDVEDDFTAASFRAYNAGLTPDVDQNTANDFASNWGLVVALSVDP